MNHHDLDDEPTMDTPPEELERLNRLSAARAAERVENFWRQYGPHDDLRQETEPELWTRLIQESTRPTATPNAGETLAERCDRLFHDHFNPTTSN